MRSAYSLHKLDDLVLFAEVVEQGGFAAAARSLGMQRSKLSRRIADLERRMDARLLLRNTRQISLTPAGEQIYRHARALADEAQAAFNVAAELHGKPKGVLRITCSATLAMNAVIPLIALFCDQYPQVRTWLDASDAEVDLVGSGLELAFRVQSTPLQDSSMVARLVSAVPMITVGSPKLLTFRKRLQHPDHLLEMGMVVLASKDSATYSLEFVRGGSEPYTLRCSPRLISGNMSVLRSAVLAGMGVANLPRYLCRDALAAGQLIDMFDPQAGWRPKEPNLYAIVPTRLDVSPTMRLFLEFSIPRLAAILNGRRVAS